MTELTISTGFIALCVLQVNIKNWKNKNLLHCNLPNYSSDVLLINETGEIPNNFIKLNGYKSISESLWPNSGVTILFINVIYQQIPINDPNTLVIRIPSNTGPIVICTSYIALRLPALPRAAYSKILKHNIPTLITTYSNAHHPFLHNTNNHGDAKGKILYKFVPSCSCNFTGVFFNTYITRYQQGKPDIVLTNNHFNIPHTDIIKGSYIGLDHIPVIIEISTAPFKVLEQPIINSNTHNV